MEAGSTLDRVCWLRRTGALVVCRGDGSRWQGRIGCASLFLGSIRGFSFLARLASRPFDDQVRLVFEGDSLRVAFALQVQARTLRVELEEATAGGTGQLHCSRPAWPHRT